MTGGSPSTAGVSTALLTDQYELTMVGAALADGTAASPVRVRGVRPPAARRAPLRRGRRHRAAARGDRAVPLRRRGARAALRRGVVDARHPGLAAPTTASPATSTATPRASCTSPARRSSPSPARSPRPWCWRRWCCRSSTTTARSPRPPPGWSPPPAGRPIIEMGSRRTHEEAAVAAARAAYLAGFAATSNLEAGRRYGIPTAGTAAHAFTLLHDDELAAFASQVAALGHGHHAARRHLRHHARASSTRCRRPGPGWARSASTPATSACWPARPATCSTRSARPTRRSSSPATSTSTRSPRCAPSRSTPTASGTVGGHRLRARRPPGMVYKLVEVDGRPVAKRSEYKESRGGRKTAVRRHKPTGTAIEEVVHAADAPAADRRRTTGCCRSR